MTVAEPGLTFAIVDHYAPTKARNHIANPQIARMINTLQGNAKTHGLPLFGLQDSN